MLCLSIAQDLLGFGIGLGPGWYTGASAGLTCSGSAFIYDIPISWDGDVVAEWVVHGTLNTYVVGLGICAASWLTT